MTDPDSAECDHDFPTRDGRCLGCGKPDGSDPRDALIASLRAELERVRGALQEWVEALDADNSDLDHDFPCYTPTLENDGTAYADCRAGRAYAEARRALEDKKEEP